MGAEIQIERQESGKTENGGTAGMRANPHSQRGATLDSGPLGPEARSGRVIFSAGLALSFRTQANRSP